MIAALKQLEAGRKAEDVAREVGVSKHTTTGEFTSEWRIRRQSLWGSARHGRGDAGDSKVAAFEVRQTVTY